jgi:RNA-directed DNA polymerase
MYSIHNPTTKLTSFELAQRGLEFCSLKKQKQVAELLGSNKKSLFELLQKPNYQTFTIPKADGGQRIIDTPCEALKGIQRILQDYLQAVYYQIRPRCVHGAIIGAADEIKPRNLLSNAKAHVGKKFFLHIDFKNFYHTINREQIIEMFASKPFNFPPKVALLLTEIVCYQKRLPMGTSSSGIVANLCLLGLDQQLQDLATKNAWTYTRFIDDITFSAKNKFTATQKEEIRALIISADLQINEEKWVENTIDDQPEITGLVIQGGRVDIKESYLKLLSNDISLYRKIMKGDHLHKRALFSANVLKHFKLQLQGQLSFVRYIRGKFDTTFVRLNNRMKLQHAM